MSRPTRIGFYVHPHILGGQESFLLRLLPRLDRRQFEPVVLFGARGEVEAQFRKLGLDTRTLTFRSFKKGYRGLVEVLRADRVALVQTNMFSPLPALAASEANVRHLWRVGGHRDVVLRRMTSAERTDFLQMMSRLSSAIICNSAYAMEPIRELGELAANVRVIRNGIPEGGGLATSRLRPRRPRIGMLAHFDRQKRHVDFIEAAHLVLREMPEARFFIYGSTFSNREMITYRRSLRARILELDLSGRVVMRRALDGPSVLSDLDLLVQPSVRESSSNALLEAMASRIPVAASNSGGNPEVVTHDETGLLFEPENARALAEAVLSLLKNPERTAHLVDAAHRDVMTRFNMELCTRRYERAYREIIGD